MTVKLRWIGGLCAIVLGTGSYVLAAHAAQSAYPSKPLRLLVPFTPGGSQDVAARLISAPAAQALGQNIVIDNRPGSGGLIAAQEAARATPDGYTLFMSSGAQMGISPALRPKIGYDPVKSFAHVIHLTDTPMVLIAYPSLPAANAKELIAYSHANRGKVNTASTGTGTYTHMTIELFKQITGADVTHIPYKGAAPAITDLIGRQIQTMFTSVASAQPHTAAGRLKGIAIAAPKRSPAMPETATFAEQGISGLEVSSWTGISLPAGVSPSIVARLGKEFSAALQNAEVKSRMTALGADLNGTGGAEFSKMVGDDAARWAKVVQTAGIKLQ